MYHGQKKRMYLEFWSSNAAPWGKMQQKEDIPFRAGLWKHGGFQSKINMLVMNMQYEH